MPKGCLVRSQAAFQVFVSTGAKMDQAYQWGQEAQK